MKKDAVRYLIGQYMNEELTAQQQIELLQLLGQHEEQELIDVLREMMEAEPVDAVSVDPETMQASLLKVLAADKAVEPATPGKLITMRRPWRWVAAAACVLVVCLSGYVLFNKKEQVTVVTGSNPYKNDVQPGGNKAVLTLANGQQIVLDSAANGLLTQEGSVEIMKEGASLKYESGHALTAVTYNMLATPKGGLYQLILPDGSKVWLNAASSIRYPTAFTGKERKVEITGEAYFEITKNPNKPFRVQLPADAGGGLIEVLGTHFNVNAYSNEDATKTTLLEGKVRLLSGDQGVVLQPGEQAVLAPNTTLTINHSPDVDQVMAWRNGVFLFRDQRIENIMKQISRWYDVEVSYTGKPTQEGFNATIPRHVPVSKVLRYLELTTLVHFKIDGKKITVLP